MAGNGPEPGERHYQLMFDAKELAQHPQLLAWMMGPLEAAMKLAPFKVSITITRVEDSPDPD